MTPAVARHRLESAGWRVGTCEMRYGEAVVVASMGGVTVNVRDVDLFAAADKVERMGVALTNREPVPALG